MLPTDGCARKANLTTPAIPGTCTRIRMCWFLAAMVYLGVVACTSPDSASPDSASSGPDGQLDPTAWGEDHVGQSPPLEYIVGGECLFCHSTGLGGAWQGNPHSLAMRPAIADEAPVQALTEATGSSELTDQVRFLVGSDENVRFLRPAGYGKLTMLSTSWLAGGLTGEASPSWDDVVFEKDCAGCHTTAMDSATRMFASPSLDCYVCHGDVDLGHSDDSRKILLSKARQDPPRVVTSICAQCHLRGGRSRSTGRPYPNNFISGDNLFRDFEADFSEANLAQLSRADRHIWENVRDVVILGDGEVTCLSCHDVHTASSDKHEDVWQRDTCFTCHIPRRDKSELHPFTTHSQICDR